MQLEKDLNEYKEITLELMKRISIQGNRLFLLKKREEILDKIKDNYDSSDISRIGKALKLDELERELEKSVLNEMDSVKKELRQLKLRHQSNQAYIVSGYGGNITSRFDKRF